MADWRVQLAYTLHATKGPFIATQLNSTKLNWTQLRS